MVAGTLAVAGCGGGGGGAPADPPAVELSDAEKAVNAAKRVVSAARTAVNGITPASTREQVAAAGKALADAETEIGNLLKADRAQFATDMRTLTERLDLDDRLAAIDAVADARAKAGMETVDIAVTDAAITAAKNAIAMLPAGDRAAYTAQLSGSETALAKARADRDAMQLADRRTMQTKALTDASRRLVAALAALAGGVPTQEQLDEADSALAVLKAAVGDAADLSATEKAGYERQAANATQPITTAKDAFAEEQKRLEAVRVAGVVKAITDTEIAAAGDAVGMVGDTSGDGDVTAAQAAIDAARDRINGADIPTSAKDRLRTALARHEGSLTTRKASRLAYRERMEDEERERLRMAKIREITDGAIQDARDAVAMVMDDSADGTVTAAREALAAAKAAIEAPEADGVLSDADQRDLHAMVEKEQGRFDKAVERRRVAIAVRAIKEGPFKSAMDAAGMLARDSSREDWAAAEARMAAAGKAVEAADIPAAKKAELRAELARHRGALDAAVGRRKAFGKAMFAAMGGHDEDTTTYRDALNNLAHDAKYVFPLSDSSKPNGLWLDPHDEGPGSLPKDGVNVSPIVFTEVKTRGQVGKWKVTDETGAVDEDGNRDADLARFHDRARVYSDRAVRTAPAATYFLDSNGDRPTHAGTYTAGTRTLSLGTGVDGSLASPEFPTSGHKDFKPEGDGKEVLVRGTYLGAPGTYRCTWASLGDCRVSKGRGGFFMAAGWEFVHEKGAEVSFLNHDFAYFGWWVRENSGDRVPRMATAFIGVRGGGIDPAADGDSRSMAGTARFEGPAVGQYAIHDPDDGKGEGGEFVAEARLDVRFGHSDDVPQTGMSGTIDRFRLNGGSGDPGWTVTLHRGAWATGGLVDNSSRTTWSVNGVDGAKGGSWGARMYDATVEDSVGGDDGNNQPDLVLGTFFTERGDTHRMVGAFGARNVTKDGE